MTGPEPLVTGFNVVAIYVSDLDRSLAFYVGLLGLEDRGENGPGRMLGAGEVTIYLEAGRSEGTGPAPGAPQISVCFAPQGVRSALKRLEEAEVPVVMDLQEFSPEFAMFSVADPDGNIIEFAGRP